MNVVDIGRARARARGRAQRNAWQQLVQRWSWTDTAALLHQLWQRERARARDEADYGRAKRQLNFVVAINRLREP